MVLTDKLVCRDESQAMFIAKVISRGQRGKTYTSILLRESYRVGTAVKSRTLAVLTHLPAHVLEAVRRAVAQPAHSLPTLASVSAGALRLRPAESLGALWTVDQVAPQLGIQQALGVTRQAELGYWASPGPRAAPGHVPAGHGALGHHGCGSGAVGLAARLHRG